MTSTPAVPESGAEVEPEDRPAKSAIRRHGDEVWIEVLDDDGRTVDLRRFDTLPLRIGADDAFELVLREPGIAAKHATLRRGDRGSPEVASALCIELTGPGAMRVNGGPATRCTHTFERWARVRMGTFDLRIVNLTVAPTSVAAPVAGRASTKSAFSTVASSALSSATQLAAGLSANALADYWARADGASYGVFLRNQLDLLPTLGLWLGASLAASRAFCGATRWAAQCRAVAGAVACYGWTKVVLPLAAARMSVSVPDIVSTEGWMVVAMLCALWQLRHWPLPRRQRIVAAVGASLFGLGVMANAASWNSDALLKRPPSPSAWPAGWMEPEHRPRDEALAELDSLKVLTDKAGRHPQVDDSLADMLLGRAHR